MVAAIRERPRSPHLAQVFSAAAEIKGIRHQTETFSSPSRDCAAFANGDRLASLQIRITIPSRRYDCLHPRYVTRQREPFERSEIK
jgi:hypothetical protein